MTRDHNEAGRDQEGLSGSSCPSTLIVHGKGTRVIADAGGKLEIESRSLVPAMADGG